MNKTFKNYKEIVEMVKMDLSNHIPFVIRGEGGSETISRVANITAIKTAWDLQDNYLKWVDCSLGLNIKSEYILTVKLKIVKSGISSIFEDFKIVCLVFKIGKVDANVLKYPTLLHKETIEYVYANSKLKTDVNYFIDLNNSILKLNNEKPFLITTLDTLNDLGLDRDGDIVKIINPAENVYLVVNPKTGRRTEIIVHDAVTKI